jgi:hypothetical protein
VASAPSWAMPGPAESSAASGDDNH